MGGKIVRLNVPAFSIAAQNFKPARITYCFEAALGNGQTSSVRCWFQTNFDKRHWLLGDINTRGFIEVVPSE